MRLSKYKRLQRKLTRRYERSRKRADTKPLATGGVLHVSHGRVHKGAGFEGQLFGAAGDIMDIITSLSPAPVSVVQEAREAITHAYR